MIPLVVERESADQLAAGASACALTVVGSHRRRWSIGRARPATTELDVRVEQVAMAGPTAIVLARSHDGDLRRVARALGRDIVRLPDERAEAAWVVGVGCSLVDADRVLVLRAMEVLCNGPGAVVSGPRRSWGELTVPALRPVTLARWALRRWSRCSWCRRGGLPGRPCGACGCSIADGGRAG